MNITLCNGFIRPAPGTAPDSRGALHNSPAGPRFFSALRRVLFGISTSAMMRAPRRAVSATGAHPNSRPARLKSSPAAPFNPFNDLETRAWLHAPTRAELLDRILQREQWLVTALMFGGLGWLLFLIK